MIQAAGPMPGPSTATHPHRQAGSPAGGTQSAVSSNLVGFLTVQEGGDSGCRGGAWAWCRPCGGLVGRLPHRCRSLVLRAWRPARARAGRFRRTSRGAGLHAQVSEPSTDPSGRGLVRLGRLLPGPCGGGAEEELAAVLGRSAALGVGQVELLAGGVGRRITRPERVGPAIAGAVGRLTAAMRELSRRASPEPDIVPHDAPAWIEATRAQPRRQAAAGMSPPRCSPLRRKPPTARSSL